MLHSFLQIQVIEFNYITMYASNIDALLSCIPSKSSYSIQLYHTSLKRMKQLRKYNKYKYSAHVETKCDAHT